LAANATVYATVQVQFLALDQGVYALHANLVVASKFVGLTVSRCVCTKIATHLKIRVMQNKNN
jgi:hypothetical protein